MSIFNKMKVMEKYVSEVLKNMDRESGLNYKGVDNEIASHFISDESSNIYPLIIECFGITFEDKTYEIYREDQNRFVIEYVVSGKGKIEIDDQVFEVKAGDSYILEPHTKQHYYANKQDPFKKYWINFRSDEIEQFLKTLKLNGIYYFPNTNLEDLFSDLFGLENVSSFSNDISFKVFQIVCNMLIRIKSRYFRKDELQIPNYLKEAKKIIDNSIVNKVSIDEICKKVYVSKPTLIESFKKYFGVTPNQYRTKRKIQLASLMLTSSNLDMNGIANNLGFTDTFTFSHWFKNNTGLSPSKYRQEKK